MSLVNRVMLVGRFHRVKAGETSTGGHYFRASFRLKDSDMYIGVVAWDDLAEVLALVDHSDMFKIVGVLSKYTYSRACKSCQVEVNSEVFEVVVDTFSKWENKYF